MTAPKEAGPGERVLKLAVRARHAADVKQYPLGEELLLYTSDRREAHALNPSARAIWELCDGSRTAGDIARKLADSLGVAATDLEPDVMAAIRDLVERGLLEVT